MIGLVTGVVINMHTYSQQKNKTKGKQVAKKEKYVTNQKSRKIIPSRG